MCIIYAVNLPTGIEFHHLIIADNGSNDGTGAIGERLAAQHENVRYLKVGKRGVGLALKAAWSASKADIVGYMDLDLATDLMHLPEALIALTKKNADIVYATRLHRNSKVIGRSLKRAVVSRCFNGMLHVYLGTRFSDGMCGFKFLWRRHLSELIQNGAVSDGWFFSTELLVIGEWLGLSLYELPVRWTDDPDSRARIRPLAIAYMKAARVLKNNEQTVKSRVRSR